MTSRMRPGRLFAAVVAAASILSGCGARNEVNDQEVGPQAVHVLDFFGNKYEAANVLVIEEILNGYMEEHADVRISYESLKGADYYAALASREKNGELDDIFMVDHDTVLAFVEHDRLADLTKLCADIPFSESMKSQMLSADGKIYWLPTTVSAFGLYCNMDLLDAHGQKLPTNLGEWEDVCQYFVSQGITPIVANNDISLKTLAIAKGFYPVYRDGRQEEVFARLNSGEEALSTYLEDGFALVRDLCEKGYVDAQAALKTEKTSDDLEAFVRGETPFMLTGVWAAERVKGMEPGFSFQIIPYPILEDGSVLVVNPDVRLAIAADGQEEALAEDFAAYFFKGENIRRFADNQSSFSPLKDTYEPAAKELRMIVEHYQDPDKLQVIGSDSRILFPIWKITAEASKKILSGQDLKEVLEQMDRQVEEAIRGNSSGI